MPELRRKLSLFDMTMIAVGSTIDSGIFFMPALIAKALLSPLWILGVQMTTDLWVLEELFERNYMMQVNLL